MTGNLPFVMFFAVLASSAYGAAPQPDAVYTFTCNGSQSRIGPCPGGGRPVALIQGSDGNFYGAAQVSVEGDSTSSGGVVFSLTPAGTLTVLHTFVPGPDKNYADGNRPGLITQGPDGKLYGYTTLGGVDVCNDGYGVLYRVNTDGSGFQIIHRFRSEGTCGGVRPTVFSVVGGNGR